VIDAWDSKTALLAIAVISVALALTVGAYYLSEAAVDSAVAPD
jgi:hypothetical protein